MTKPQIIHNEDGSPAFALVPYKDWEAIERRLEEVEDVRAFDRAKARRGETFPASVVDALVSGTSPVRVFRQHRGLTQRELASCVQVTPNYLSQIETGRQKGSPSLLQKLAEALRVDVDVLGLADGFEASKKSSIRAIAQAEIAPLHKTRRGSIARPSPVRGAASSKSRGMKA